MVAPLATLGGDDRNDYQSRPHLEQNKSKWNLLREVNMIEPVFVHGGNGRH